MNVISRKIFILNSVVGATGMMILPQIVTGQQTQQMVKPQKSPPLNKELVREFVIVAHKDFDKVKSMLQETPDLLNASLNLKDWDWEDAVGAAGHMGFRDMALYLLEQGARPTICVAAMLGNLEVVRTFITAFPQMKNSVGPHNITLLDHARAGGEQAQPVVDYLASIDVKK